MGKLSGKLAVVPGLDTDARARTPLKRLGRTGAIASALPDLGSNESWLMVGTGIWATPAART